MLKYQYLNKNDLGYWDKFIEHPLVLCRGNNLLKNIFRKSGDVFLPNGHTKLERFVNDKM